MELSMLTVSVDNQRASVQSFPS